MIDSPARRALPVLVLLAVAGCSFRGSISAANPATVAGAGGRAPSSSSPARPTATGSPGAAAPSGTSSSPEGRPAGSPSTGGTGGVERCHTGELAASLVPGSAGAGQRYATVVLENTGGRTCTVHGYGGIGLVDAAGAPLPTRQVRVASPAPTTVSVAPGAAVRSQLHWSAVPGAGDATSGPCRPTPAALQVIPPDETDHLSVPWHGGPVCEAGTIEQQAYTAG